MVTWRMRTGGILDSEYDFLQHRFLHQSPIGQDCMLCAGYAEINLLLGYHGSELVDESTVTSSRCLIILPDFLQLAHISLLARLADKTDAVYTRLFAVTIPICYE